MAHRGHGPSQVAQRLTPLIELTKRLTGTPGGTMPRVIVYDVENGIAHGVGLFKNHAVAVQLCEMSAGSSFRRHEHDGSEWLIVVEGSFTIDAEEPEYAGLRIGAGEAAHLPAGLFHGGRADKHESLTRIVGITIPADPGYPGVGN